MRPSRSARKKPSGSNHGSRSRSDRSSAVQAPCSERDGKLAGFHWTKIHGTPPQVGEVYVVGVDPAGQGGGLGRALTLAGLRYLRSRGLPEVMLYVDEDNTPAIRLYESLGFTHRGTDVMFRHPPG